MTTLYPNLILDALRNVRYPGNGKNLVENDMVEDDIRIDGNKVSFSLVFERPTDPFIRSVVRAAETAINTFISPDVDVRGNIAVKYRKAQPEKKPEVLPGVKNIIGSRRPAIRSGFLTPIFSVPRCRRCSEWRMRPYT